MGARPPLSAVRRTARTNTCGERPVSPTLAVKRYTPGVRRRVRPLYVLSRTVIFTRRWNLNRLLPPARSTTTCTAPDPSVFPLSRMLLPARMRFVAALAVTTGASDRATGGVGGVAEGGGATRWAATRSAGSWA